MADKPDTIDMTPSFRQAAHLLLAMFESGTPKGRAMAREELLNWAGMLDDIKAGKLNTNKKDA